MTKLLRRIKARSVLGGVCEGLGKYFGNDPIIWRLIFIIGELLTIVPFLLVYIVMWIVVPKEDK